MEELDLKELLELFWHKKVKILLIVAIFVAIGVIYTVGFVTPKYTASTTLVLATSQDSSTKTNTITTSDITLNSKLVSTYSVLVKSKSVTRKVISNLGINITEDELIYSCEYKGVTDIAESSINYLIQARCNPEKKLQARRNVLRCILDGLEKNNIKVPYNQIDVHQK